MWPFSSSCDNHDASSCSATPPSILPTLLEPSVFLSCAPLLAIFSTAFILSHARLFPRISRARRPGGQYASWGSGNSSTGGGNDYFLPSHAPPALHAAHAAHASRMERQGDGSLCGRVCGILGLGGPEKTVFAVTVALAAELGTVILADVSGVLDPRARGIVLGWTVKGLLGLLVLVIPAMQLHGVLNGVGVWRRAVSGMGRKGKKRLWPWVFLMTLWGGWIFVFWSVGAVLPSSSDKKGSRVAMMTRWDLDTVTQMAVARIGVLGIASLALLSGFASVTTPWYTFGCSPAYRAQPPSETDIARRQVGLDAATEMRVSKQHRLRSLQRKQRLAANPPRSSTSSVSSTAGDTTTGLGTQQRSSTSDLQAAASGSTTGAGNQPTPSTVATKFWSSIKNAVTAGLGDPDAHEIRMLQLEIQGLEDMEARLASGLASLVERKKEGERRKTKLGRWVLRPTELGFAVYCVYRVLMTVILVSVRVVWSSTPASSTGGGSIWGTASEAENEDEALASVDPVTRFLAVVTVKLGLVNRENIDVAAWARMIAFLLSGVILVGSANSVVQTSRLMGRWLPKKWGVMNAARRNLALGVGQVGGMYVIGAAVMLRGRVGGRIVGREGLAGYYADGGDVFGALGEETRTFVDRWFEGWFLYAALATVAGVWIMGYLGRGDDMGIGGGVGDEDEWEEKGGVELGWKRS
ncbi:putative g protein-coupled receptor [Zalerion maritima]|uniref:G protein-coupled receptor n=1 Tax=Zalerion maritima TaxID=339359 RepID=A0AAD5RYL3_9PEZI|nr:putative g protein-coupled receptor [Zalerion maritima]